MTGQPAAGPTGEERAEVREQVARWLFEDHNPGGWRWVDCADLHDIWLDEADALIAAVPAIREALALRQRVEELAAQWMRDGDAPAALALRRALAGRDGDRQEGQQ